MNFIAPEFLYALGFLAIPILIHLFNFRRYKTVQFSQVRFLKSIKKQTQSTSRLKHLIVLLCRCLALAALVVAFAQPFFPTDNNASEKGKKGIVVYIDNSFSMQASAEVGSLLDEAKNKAIAIANAHEPADKFQLHSNAFDADEQRWMNKEAFINKLQEIDFSPKFRGFDAVSNRLLAAENDDDFSLDYYLIGDLQKTSYEISTNQDSVKFYVLPVRSQQSENTWISDFSTFQPFHLPGMTENFTVKIKQTENGERSQINGKLLLNGEFKNPFIIDLQNDSAEKELNFNNPDEDHILGKIAIKDYPVIFDDTFYFFYPTDRKIKLLHLFEDIKNKSVNSLFAEDSLINYQSQTIKQIDFSTLSAANILVLENITTLSSGLVSEITSFIKQGGTLVCFPSMTMDVASVNSLFNQFGIRGYGKKSIDTLYVSDLNIKNSLFTNVFEEVPKNINYPKSYQSWNILPNQNNVSEPVLTYSDGNAFLKKYELNNGTIFLCASNLDGTSSNFGKHALFVPSLYNMSLQAARKGKTSYLLDETKIVINAVQFSESPLKLKKGNYEWIPKQIRKENNSVELFLRNQINEPGFYSVLQNDQEIEKLAFNYNRNESDLAQFTGEVFKIQAEKRGLTIELLNDEVEKLSTSISARGNTQGLWKYFILLSLFFIGLEILFLRILK